MAVQEGLTSIRVSWSPPTPLGDTTGYRIYYSGGSSGSEDVSGGSTDNYLLTSLQNGESYTISIVATSQHLPSESVVHNIALGETRGLMDHLMYKSYKCDIIHTPVAIPSQPDVVVTTTTATSISLFWSVPSGSEVTSSEVMWRVISSSDDGSSSTSSSGSIASTSYTIQELETNTLYLITVTVTNAAGSTVSQPVIITTSDPDSMKFVYTVISEHC